MKVLKKIGHFFECFLPVGGMFAIQLGIVYLYVLFATVILVAKGYNMYSPEANSIYGEDALMAVTVAAQAVTALVAFLVYRFGLKNKKLNKFTKTFSWKTIPALVLAFWGFSIITSSLLQVTYMIYPSIIEEYSELMEDIGISDTSLLAIISTVIMAPVSEELVFRGLTLSFGRRFTKRFWIANFIQAICFGVAHGNIVQGTYAFGLGLVLGYIYRVYNNILVPMLCHCLYNIMGGYLVLYVFGDSEELEILRFFVATLVALIGTYAGVSLVKKEKNYALNVENFNIRSGEYYTKANRIRERKKKNEEIPAVNAVSVENVNDPFSFTKSPENMCEEPFEPYAQSELSEAEADKTAYEPLNTEERSE